MPDTSDQLQSSSIDQSPTAPITLPTEPVPNSPGQLTQAATSAIATLISEYPQSYEPHIIAAQFAQSTYQYDDAKDHWQAVLKLSPDETDAQIGMARVAIAQGRPQDAVNQLTKLLPLSSPTAAFSLSYARGLQQTGDLEHAIKHIDTAVQQFPVDAEILEVAAEINTQAGQLEKAEEYFIRAITQRPEKRSLHFGLAGVYRRLGKAKLAQAYQEQAAKLRPKVDISEDSFEVEYDQTFRFIVSRALADVAQFYLNQARYDDAQSQAIQAIEIFPQGAHGYQVLSQVFYRQKQIGQAFFVHQRLVEVAPNDPSNYVNLSKLAFMSGRQTVGRDALLEANRRQPGSALITSALATYYLESGDFREAKSYAEQSIGIRPTLTAYQVLATACGQMNDRVGERTAEQAAMEMLQSPN